jgi:N-acetylneuraminic acid mutarotase
MESQPIIYGLHTAVGSKALGVTVWRYTPGSVGVNGNWQEMKDFPGTARYQANGAAATIGGVDVGLLVGGIASGSTPLGDAWEYSPSGDSWGKLPNIAGGTRENPAVFVLGKSLFVASCFVDVLGWSR